MDYEDKIFIYLQKQPPGWKMPVSRLTDNPERFIEAVKYLIRGEWLKDVCFSADYKTIKKDEEHKPGIKELLRKNQETITINGKTYKF